MLRLQVFGALVGFLVVGACGTSGLPQHATDPPGSWHTVVEGETPADLAARTGVPLEDLLEINGLRRTDKLRPGQLVFLLDPRGLSRPTLAESGRSTITEPPRARAAPAGRWTAPVAAPEALGPGGLRWPLAAPRLTSAFGQRQGRPHEGIDLGAATGTPIFAAREGTVLYAGDAIRGYGNMVVLGHHADLLTVYAHSSVLLVRTGDRVATGQTIARVGQSGHATAPHLHFEVRRGQVPQDPLQELPPLR